MKNNYFIGLSVTYHDPAIAIVDAGRRIIFAEATERYLQSKRALNCEPDHLNRIIELIREYCPAPARIHVAFNWQKKRPFYERFCAAADYFSAQGLLRPRFKKRATFLEKYKIFHMLACQTRAMDFAGVNLVRMVQEAIPAVDLRFHHFNHHKTHAAFACYGSPFFRSDCVVVDSYGEQGSLAFYRYYDGQLRLFRQVSGIASLGFFYMKLTELCGFDWVLGEEWKVMGLAAYGSLNQEIYEQFRSMISVDGLGLVQHLSAIRAGMERLEQQFKEKSPMEAADLAFTGQYFFSELMCGILQNYGALGFSENIVVCGGCGLNSSFNGQILQQTSYRRLYIPPAPADDGTAVGAALLACDRIYDDQARSNSEMLTPYLGSQVSRSALERLIRFNRGLLIRRYPLSISQETAQLLAKGQIIGWIQGRAEFGPRALGNRSILADPRQLETKDQLNSSVKMREEFRPFAPAILHEYGEQYFEDYVESPYMERALKFRPEVRERVPAVVHADFSGRLQTVKPEWNQRFYDLLLAFYRITNVPIVLNTSFNVMGKPIVHSVEDAVSVLMTTGLDALVIDDYLIAKPTD